MIRPPSRRFSHVTYASCRQVHPVDAGVGLGRRTRAHERHLPTRARQRIQVNICVEFGAVWFVTTATSRMYMMMRCPAGSSAMATATCWPATIKLHLCECLRSGDNSGSPVWAHLLRAAQRRWWCFLQRILRAYEGPRCPICCPRRGQRCRRTACRITARYIEVFSKDGPPSVCFAPGQYHFMIN